MSRLLRYLLIWFSCTAASVSAVMVTVHFVVGTTTPTPPVAQSAATDFGSPSPSATSDDRAPSPSPTPTPSRSAKPTADPTPSKKPEKPRTSAPAPATGTTSRPPDQASGPNEGQGCEQGGSGVHTVPSQGGKVTVRYGSGGVCLVSAVPNRGFTAGTTQSAAETLTVTFSGSGHRSEVTATTVPVDRASVRETSW
ncbi:hypothetical protein OG883_32660 [Streptomyces sp. NBC_01142]|uniref:hypothetical protein n=1 Tax=Streptomyces sp. NBC_01142 TaxID=2975865 RepID=UPI0022565A19|nr:hypothetical protein [Streptomyces sp. NBC_01142]MCX4824527.1 hypothetical protein [Streptomyces sp. NBC_01142]